MKLFDTPEEAVVDFGIKYNSISILEAVELGTRIYRKGDKYYYKAPFKGKRRSVIPVGIPSWRFWCLVGTIHTHGDYPGSDSLSWQDKFFLPLQGTVYVVSPSGAVRRYKRKLEEDITPDYNLIPSDTRFSNHKRKSKVNPYWKEEKIIKWWEIWKW